MISFRELKEQAKNDLRGNWVTAIGVGLLAGLLGAGGTSVPSMTVTLPTGEVEQSATASDHLAPSPLSGELLAVVMIFVLIVAAFGLAISLLFTNVIRVGYCRFNLDLAEGRPLQMTTLFSGFQNWGYVVRACGLQTLIIFLKTLLFIIPGMIATYDYAMVPYLMADRPYLSAREALAESKAMMRGHRFELFCLELSFYGWALLCVLTCGVGFVWLTPYMQATLANYYQELSGSGRASFTYGTFQA